MDLFVFYFSDRILEIQESDSNGELEAPRKLVEVFVYPEKGSSSDEVRLFFMYWI